MKEKLKYLDGLRGLMAINVIINHFIVFYYPQMYFKGFYNSEDALSLFSCTPLSGLVNGDIAVQYFLILTGFFVSRSCILSAKNNIKKVGSKICNRYIRLLPVIAAATIFTHITMIFGVQYHIEISGMIPNGNFLATYCNFNPTAKTLLYNIFIKTFTEGSSYIGPFWTIPLEFFGYILCLVVCTAFKDKKYRRIVYFALCGVMWFSSRNYSTLILGVIVADMYYKNEKDSTIFSPLYYKIFEKKQIALLLLIIGSLMACCPIWLKNYGFTIVRKIITKGAVKRLGIALMLAGLVRLPKIQKLYEFAPIQWLGKFSYEIYAFHWPVMLVVQARLFAAFYEKMPYNEAAVLAFLVTIPVILVVSYLMYLLVSKNKNYSIEGIVGFFKKHLI